MRAIVFCTVRKELCIVIIHLLYNFVNKKFSFALLYT
nr:MAG TPA: hypothetical protein [Caudoviricetes sp.]